MSLLKIMDVASARRSILRRANLWDIAIPASLQASLRGLFGRDLTPDEAVRQILREIQNEGDDALYRWTERIDGVRLDSLLVPPAASAAARAAIPAELDEALTTAAGRIRAFHERQPLPNWETTELGGRLGQRVRAINRVGVYVPGGTAPLPSSLLMGVIPAQVAGVKEIVVATPPGPDGRVPDVILAAAAITGVDRIYRLGGAQAIGALTFGSAEAAPVDKIVGPGNLFVTLAKRQVFGLVGIDGFYGPTETLVIADANARPEWIAADLLAQAEHDVLATAILLTPAPELAAAVQAAVGRQLETLSRAEIAAAALTNQGGIVLTADLAEAAALANEFAAEHLCLAVADPAGLAATIDNAGGLFLGERSFEVLGDYVAGPSHTMPTGGSARFASPLNVMDFVRINSIVDLDDVTADLLAPVAARLAEAEALTAHAQAARIRLTGRADTAGADR